jgi:hypothetical protein
MTKSRHWSKLRLWVAPPRYALLERSAAPRSVHQGHLLCIFSMNLGTPMLHHLWECRGERHTRWLPPTCMLEMAAEANSAVMAAGAALDSSLLDLIFAGAAAFDGHDKSTWILDCKLQCQSGVMEVLSGARRLLFAGCGALMRLPAGDCSTNRLARSLERGIAAGRQQRWSSISLLLPEAESGGSSQTLQSRPAHLAFQNLPFDRHAGAFVADPLCTMTSVQVRDTHCAFPSRLITTSTCGYFFQDAPLANFWMHLITHSDTWRQWVFAVERYPEGDQPGNFDGQRNSITQRLLPDDETAFPRGSIHDTPYCRCFAKFRKGLKVRRHSARRPLHQQRRRRRALQPGRPRVEVTPRTNHGRDPHADG